MLGKKARTTKTQKIRRRRKAQGNPYIPEKDLMPIHQQLPAYKGTICDHLIWC